MVDPVRTALAMGGAGQALDLQLHQALCGKSHQFTRRDVAELRQRLQQQHGSLATDSANYQALCPLTFLTSAGCRNARLLQGFRGRPAADLAALADTLVRVSYLAVHLEGHLAELDINPLMVLPPVGE